MLNLIYKGSVSLRSEKERVRLQDTLSFFNVSSDVTNSKPDSGEEIPGSLKVHLLNRIPLDINQLDCSILEDNRRDSHPEPAVTLEDKPEVNHHQNIEPEIEESSVSSRLRKRRSTPVQAQAPDKHPAVKLPRMKTRNQQSQLPPPVPVQVAEGPSQTVLQQESKEDEDLSTDSEDENWEQPNYRDKQWFLRESRRCQICSKTFKLMTDASLCLSTHKTGQLRCYFCFTMYQDTNSLMRHFTNRHKQAPGKEKSLVCPYCDQSVPYNSASVHVITQHFNSKKDDDGGSGGGVNKSTVVAGGSSSNGRTGRSKTVSPSPPNLTGKKKVKSTPPPVMDESVEVVAPPEKKKKKVALTFGKMNKMMRKGDGEKEGDGEDDDEVEVVEEVEGSTKKKLASNLLVLKDMDFTLEKVTCEGKILTFRLQKKRDLMEPVELDD